MSGIGLQKKSGGFVINQLTKEQKSKIAEYRDKWLAIGLSTSPTDRKKAEQIIDEVYLAGGLATPKFKIWVQSPYRGALAAAMLPQIFKWGAQVRNQVRNQVYDQVGDQVRAQVGAQVRAQVGEQVYDQVYDQVCAQVYNQVRAQVYNQVRAQVGEQVGAQILDQVCAQVRAQVCAQVYDQVRAQVYNQVRAQVYDQVRAQVYNQVRAQVYNQVRNQVRNQVYDQVGDQVRAQVRAQVGEQVNNCGYGLHDASWLGFYDFFAEVLELKCCSKLIPLINISKFCGWWWPFENAVIFTEKPIELHRDARNRLHNLDGYAVSYSDGWGVYAIHGVRVPEKYILTPAEKIDPKEVLAEPNAEVRTAVIKKCGFQHFLKHLKSKKISMSENGKAELLEFDLGNSMRVRGLHVWWDDKAGHKETVIPVPRTKAQFESTGDVPDDIDDAESVRRWTLFAGKEDRFLAET